MFVPPPMPMMMQPPVTAIQQQPYLAMAQQPNFVYDRIDQPHVNEFINPAMRPAMPFPGESVYGMQTQMPMRSDGLPPPLPRPRQAPPNSVYGMN